MVPCGFELGEGGDGGTESGPELPGLVSKTWLANEDTNTYGGVYVWQDREAMEAYRENDIYKGMMDNPYFKDFTVSDFAVLEAPTRITRGAAEATV